MKESKLSKQYKELWQMANEIDNVIDRVIRDDHSNNKANLPLAELALMQQISDELGYESSWEKLGFDKTDSVERLIESQGGYNDFAEQLWEDIKDTETCDVLQSIGNIAAEGQFVIDAANEVIKQKNDAMTLQKNNQETTKQQLCCCIKHITN